MEGAESQYVVDASGVLHVVQLHVAVQQTLRQEGLDSRV